MTETTMQERREYARKYRQEHLEELKAYSLQYYYDHWDKIQESHRKYKQDHPKPHKLTRKHLIRQWYLDHEGVIS